MKIITGSEVEGKMKEKEMKRLGEFLTKYSKAWKQEHEKYL
jgi:hypothetical protein